MAKILPNVNPEGSEYAFERATEHYAYGMDLGKPWDVIIYRTNEDGAPLSIVTPDDLHKKAVYASHAHEKQSVLWVNEELETEAIVCMSQGMAGYQMKSVSHTYEGLSELGDPIDLKICTTSEEFFADV